MIYSERLGKELGIDATEWAEEFVEQAQAEGSENYDRVIERHYMLDWFSSAIRTGITAGQAPVATLDMQKACEILHNAAGFTRNGDGTPVPFDDMSDEYRRRIRAGVQALRINLMGAWSDELTTG